MNTGMGYTHGFEPKSFLMAKGFVDLQVYMAASSAEDGAVGALYSTIRSAGDG